MLLSKDNIDATYIIESYTPAGVCINKVLYTQSLIITPHTLMTDWNPPAIHELTSQDLEPLVALEPEIILLGSGESLQFPTPYIHAFILGKRIGLEVMNSHRACQTFMALAAENRKVALGLLIKG